MRTAHDERTRRADLEVETHEAEAFEGPDIPLPAPRDELAPDVGYTPAPARDEDVGLKTALHDVATAGQDLLVDRLELFKLEMAESLKVKAEQVKDKARVQVEKVKVSAREQVEKVKVSAREQVENVRAQARHQATKVATVAKQQATRAALFAGAGALFVIAWGLLCAAAVVAISGELGVAPALAIVAAPHLLFAGILFAKASKNPTAKRG